MANCVSKNSSKKEKPPPDKSFESHTHTKRHLRLGVNFEKSPDGEIHVGLKSGFKTHKDKVIHVGDSEQDEEKALEHIPTIKEIMEQ